MPRRRGPTEQAVDAAVDTACRMLRLPTIRSRFEESTGAAEHEQQSYRGFLAELLMAERDDRARRRIKVTRFPRENYLRTFDFDANPDINPAMIHTPAKCDWVRKGVPLCSIGVPGGGKPHLFIALGTEAATAGCRVKYTLDTKLIKELVEAADDRISTETIARYGRVDLLRIDELGYMDLDKRGTELLFQVLTEREERTASRSLPTTASGRGRNVQRFETVRRRRRPTRFRRQHRRTGIGSYRLTYIKPPPSPTLDNRRRRGIGRYEVVSV